MEGYRTGTGMSPYIFGERIDAFIDGPGYWLMIGMAVAYFGAHIIWRAV